ncbi:MAG TPA: hypothetical protein VHC42_02415 [Rhizomicrobium sp.]|nr:hypothetical protein [Rhizomicrobium sp.]
MAEGDFEEEARPSAPADTAAMHAALSGSSDEAREYLRKQSRLADLQIETLQKRDEFELSHLRWRRLNDQLTGAFRIILVVLALAVLAGVSALLWNASEADGLVVDSFSAPAELARTSHS